MASDRYSRHSAACGLAMTGKKSVGENVTPRYRGDGCGADALTDALAAIVGLPEFDAVGVGVTLPAPRGGCAAPPPCSGVCADDGDGAAPGSATPARRPLA